MNTIGIFEIDQALIQVKDYSYSRDISLLEETPNVCLYRVTTPIGDYLFKFFKQFNNRGELVVYTDMKAKGLSTMPIYNITKNGILFNLV